MKFLRTKPQVKSMNINFYEWYYTVIKNREDKQTVNDEYENNANDYINFDNFFGIKLRKTILRLRKMSFHINHVK